MIDGREQMTRAGRFLYLDRAQAKIISDESAEDGSWARIIARHDGYHSIGVIHQRIVTAFKDDRWIVEDFLQPAGGKAILTPHTFRLHWLLPDWGYKMEDADCRLGIESPEGVVSLIIKTWAGRDFQPATCGIQLVRAGELLHGSGIISSTWGWVSPTYGEKIPALSFSTTVTGKLPVKFTSEWIFPEGA
jgi:hypothetical protein